MAEIPRRLVRNRQRALELVRGNAFLRFAHQIDRKEPFPERQMRIVKDRASGYGELIAAIIAVILTLLFKSGHAFGFATRTFNAFRPAKIGQVVATFVLTVELVNKLHKVHVELTLGNLW